MVGMESLEAKPVLEAPLLFRVVARRGREHGVVSYSTAGTRRGGAGGGGRVPAEHDGLAACAVGASEWASD